MPPTKSGDKTGTPTTERSDSAKLPKGLSPGDEVLTVAEATGFLRVSHRRIASAPFTDRPTRRNLPEPAKRP